MSSFKNSEFQVIKDMSSFWAFLPRGDMGIQNYLDVFRQMPFFRFLFNSTLIVTVLVCCGLFINSMMAYALARLEFRFKWVILSIIIALIIVPFEAVAIPLLLMVNHLGWVDSYHVQIIPFIADALSIFLFYQFFIG